MSKKETTPQIWWYIWKKIVMMTICEMIICSSRRVNLQPITSLTASPWLDDHEKVVIEFLMSRSQYNQGEPTLTNCAHGNLVNKVWQTNNRHHCKCASSLRMNMRESTFPQYPIESYKVDIVLMWHGVSMQNAPVRQRTAQSIYRPQEACYGWEYLIQLRTAGPSLYDLSRLVWM